MTFIITPCVNRKGKHMENNFTPEQIEMARTAKSPEELLYLAKESGVELSEEQANTYFEQLNKSGEMSDNELNNVSGGACGPPLPPNCVDANHSCDKWVCEHCGKPKDAVSRIHFHNTFPIYRHCDSCKYSSFDNPRYLCNHPSGKG